MREREIGHGLQALASHAPGTLARDQPRLLEPDRDALAGQLQELNVVVPEVTWRQRADV